MTVAKLRPSRVLALVAMDDAEPLDPLAIITGAAAIGAELGVQVHALLLGRAPQDEQATEALYAGADRVWLVSHPGLAVPVQTDQLLPVFEDALSQSNAASDGETTLVLLSAGAVGEELAARLAARTQGVALGRCAAIEATAQGLVVRRPAFAGRAQATLTPEGGPMFAAMRVAKRRRETADTHRADDADAVRRLVLDTALPVVDVSYVEVGPKMARLEGAKVVVSGGRGIGGPEGFAVLDKLAASLGGVLGGSLPTVDAGWVPVARQVGQSGRYVTPEVYVAIGISGTPQHLAGIGLDSRIVAINSDAEANIFNVAEIGVVAEWQNVVPALIEAVNGSESS